MKKYTPLLALVKRGCLSGILRLMLRVTDGRRLAITYFYYLS